MRAWWVLFFATSALAAFGAVQHAIEPDPRHVRTALSFAFVAVVMLIQIFRDTTTAEPPSRTDADRFGPNGAVLDRMSVETRAEHESAAERHGFDYLTIRQGILLGLGALLSACVAIALPDDWVPPAWFWIAIFAASFVSLFDAVRTRGARGLARAERLRWSELDHFSKLAWIASVLAAFAVFVVSLHPVFRSVA